MNDEKTKQKQKEEIIKCSVEKETVPKNQIDLRLLRSTFEKSSSKSDQRRSHPGGFSDSTIPNPAGSTTHGEDVVDQSQPSMAEVLVKFRRMERSRRPRSETGRRVRSSSAEGYERLRFSDDLQESGQNRRSMEFEDSEDQETTPQIRHLVALFSHKEGKKSSRGALKKRETEQQRFGGKSKGSQKEREPGQGSDGEGETELPEEGVVQVLLLQWKAMEQPLKKKRMSWVERQASRQAEQRKAQSAWKPVTTSSQKTSVSGQKTIGTSTKNPTAFQNTTVTSKKSTVAFQGTTAVVASTKSQMTTQKTQATLQKTQTVPQKTQVAEKTEVATQKSKVEIQKQDVQDGGIKDRTASTKDIRSINGFIKSPQRQRPTTEDFDERTGKEKEDDHVTFDGIKNMTDKFRELERRNASTDELDGPHKRKQYKWDVKPVATLGRLQGQSIGTGSIVVTYNRSTLTPPSSPEPGHVSERRQPDVVEHSNGWKSEVEEFPLPSQTKNLRAKFEAQSVHQSD